MRRTPSTDTIRIDRAAGAPTGARFDTAYRELADARAAYDAALGDPERVAELATAAVRLDAARWTMQAVRDAA